MNGAVGKYFTNIVERGKYGNAVIRLPHGQRVLLDPSFSFPVIYAFGDKVLARVYAEQQNRHGSTLFAEVVEVRARTDLRETFR